MGDYGGLGGGGSGPGQLTWLKISPLMFLVLAAVNFADFQAQFWIFRTKARLEDSVFVATPQDGSVAYFSVDPRLNRAVQEVYKAYRPPYAALVAVDANTGRVLALVGYSKSDPKSRYNLKLATRNTYPAASVFKVVTALAAVRTLGLRPADSVVQRGRVHSRSPRWWLRSRRIRRLTFAEAFGESNNPVFGRLAHKLGARPILKAAKDLGFGRFGWAGEVEEPKGTYELMLMGAGFVNSTLSPLHGALLAAAVANGGWFLKPNLIDSVVKDGKVVWRFEPETLWRAMKPSEAQALAELMAATVHRGTSYRAFYDPDGMPVMTGVTLGGKTGTLTGRDPYGKCEWFVGFGKRGGRGLAVGSIVVNRRRRRLVKGSYPAQRVLEAFFGGTGRLPACVRGPWRRRFQNNQEGG